MANHLSTYFPTYLSSLQRWFYASFMSHQAWTLIYIFIFSQMFTYWFRVFHPNHNKPGDSDLSYCGSTRCCCSKKPFNRLTKVFCCLNFGFKPASTPEEFVSAVRWFLGGPIRLAILPGLLIGIVEMIEEGFFYPSLPDFFTTRPFMPFILMPF